MKNNYFLSSCKVKKNGVILVGLASIFYKTKQNKRRKRIFYTCKWVLEQVYSKVGENFKLKLKFKLKLNKDYKIGMRAIKTALAVTICAVVSFFLNHDHEDLLYSCIAAMACIKPTYEQSIDKGVHRFLGTLIGGAIGYGALELLAILPHPEYFRILALPICVLIVVYICNLLNRKRCVYIGCVVVIIIISRLGSSRFDNTFLFVCERVLNTLLGVLVAGVLNKFLGAKLKYGKSPRKENADVQQNL